MIQRVMTTVVCLAILAFHVVSAVCLQGAKGDPGINGTCSCLLNPLNTSIVPAQANTFDLGSALLSFSAGYINTVSASSVNVGGLVTVQSFKLAAGAATGKLFTSDSTGGASWQTPQVFQPPKTLFVAKSWPSDYTVPVYFTKIQDAINQAASFNPSYYQLVVIRISSGIYNENLKLVSNIALVGDAYGTVHINGSILWTPGWGLNAAYFSKTEKVSMYNIGIGNPSFAGDPVHLFNTTAVANKGTTVLLQLIRCILNCPLLYTCPTVTSWINFEFKQFEQNAGMTLRTIGGIIADGVVLGTISIQDQAIVTMINCLVSFDVTVASLSSLFANSISMYSGILTITGSGTAMYAYNSQLQCFLSVDTGAYADIRSSWYTSLNGVGQIDRTWWSTTKTAASGANTITISPPYSTSAYTVMFTQTSGAAAAVPIVTSKTASSLVFTGAASVNYDVTFVQL